MNYKEAFKGYDVPENIKNIATLISMRFAINGVCDPMYIANTVATTCNIGDGNGHFTSDEISNSQTVAEKIQGSYGCNILKSEIEELKNIIDIGIIDKNIAIDGMKAFIKRNEKEMKTCDEWRIDYLNNQINTLNKNINLI